MCNIETSLKNNRKKPTIFKGNYRKGNKNFWVCEEKKRGVLVCVGGGGGGGREGGGAGGRQRKSGLIIGMITFASYIFSHFQI